MADFLSFDKKFKKLEQEVRGKKGGQTSDQGNKKNVRKEKAADSVKTKNK